MDKLAESTSSTFLVTQSNDLIEAQYSPQLTTMAHKLAKLILGCINPQEKQKELSVVLDIDKLKRFLGWEKGKTWNRFNRDLKDITKKLNKEPIEIFFEKEKKLKVIYFLSSYEIDGKNRLVTFDISPKLIPFLIELKKNFTTYELKYIPNLSSSYAIRIYELLYQYRKIGSRKVGLEKLRKYLAVPESYKFNDIKKRALDPSQKQLKQHTNIHFVYSPIKTGRKVTALEFVIFGNTPQTSNSAQLSLAFLSDAITDDGEQEQEAALSERIVTTMTELGISEQNIAKYLTLGFDVIDGEKKKEEAIKRCSTLENYYLEKLELTKLSNQRENAAGFFIKALKEDWTNSKRMAEKKASEAAKLRLTAKKTLEKARRDIDKLIQKQKNEKKRIATDLFKDESLLAEAHKSTLDGMSDFIRNVHRDKLSLPIRQQYEEIASLRSSMDMYITQKHPAIFEPVKAISEQIKGIEKEIEQLKRAHPSLKYQQ